jgi:hypothetical protein
MSVKLPETEGIAHKRGATRAQKKKPPEGGFSIQIR